MSLQDEINKRISEEITNDPDGLGYAGKTEDEVMLLLNSPIQKQRTVIDTYPPPINKILSGLAFAPNVIALTDVTSAKAVQVDPIIG